MYKKNPQNEEYTIIPPPTVFLLFADFCGGYVPPAIVFFAAEVPRFNLGAYWVVKPLKCVFSYLKGRDPLKNSKKFAEM